MNTVENKEAYAHMEQYNDIVNQALGEVNEHRYKVDRHKGKKPERETKGVEAMLMLDFIINQVNSPEKQKDETNISRNLNKRNVTEKQHNQIIQSEFGRISEQVLESCHLSHLPVQVIKLMK